MRKAPHYGGQSERPSYQRTFFSGFTSRLPPLLIAETRGAAVGGKLAVTPRADVGERATISNSDPPGESRRGSPQVVLIVLCSLAAITASALLLFYLRRRSLQFSQQQQPLLDSFFCPPENEKSRDNLGEIDRCTCCSSSRGDQSAAATSAKSAVAPRRKTRKKRKRNKTDVSRHYSENEELRSRIACILRDQCNLRVIFKICVANESFFARLRSGQPKRGRFKFFRKSKDKKTCNDARCDENKISCLVDLCSNQPRDNDDDSKAIRGKPGLRIKE
ncbi:hypothetical protein TSAR_012066 [Trichomalopsis sarcophagae]|uniref:Uncharacterized protein n=1 Tax=Trichomalopsis sarcophagae TaxID=543379 RepID=A0A232EVE0_9HYME|nr:hypothetical protein TSAR_012066 [Trichomalopsis sarcophagae]